ncbi:MAG: DUF2461 domain-containing protein [Cryomorphaceae bacterium]|nr:DUF2461 domain-containing protein [Flavobacteriales bacterium]
MAFFNEDFNRFFIELAANNHKDWFDENRERYHNSIKNPFENFVAALSAKMAVDEPELANMDSRKFIFRINRDIRFAKDKSPYKLNRSAAISKYGRKNTANAGLYIQLGPENVVIAGGAYQPNREELQALREGIINRHHAFEKVISHEPFVSKFGEIRGEENKRLPGKEMTEFAKKQPLLYKKQFYYWAELPPEMVTDNRLLETVIAYHNAAKPFREFVENSLR